MQKIKTVIYWILCPLLVPCFVVYGFVKGILEFKPYFWQFVGYWQRTRIKILDRNRFENDVVFEEIR